MLTLFKYMPLIFYQSHVIESISASLHHELPNSTSNITDIHEAYFYFENKQHALQESTHVILGRKGSLKFSQFEFELMRHPCYFRTKRKSLKFSQFEFEFELMRHPCYFRKKRKSLKFYQFEFEFMRHPCYFRKKRKSLKISQFEFEFELMRHPCYFRKKSKSLKFSQFEFC